MILDDLYRYYEACDIASPLSREPNLDDQLCPRFWTVKSVEWQITFDDDGRVLACKPVATADGKGIQKLLPDIARTSGVRPFVFADNATYVLGDDPKRGERAHDAFKEIHHAILDAVVDEPAARAFLKLLDRDPASLEIDETTRQALGERKGNGIIAFHYDDDPTWMQLQNKAVLAGAWERYAKQGADGGRPSGTCLVTGDEAPLAGLFPQVTGIPGAQGAGASLVSFNQPAFCSYGHDAASISTDAAYKCGEALRYLLKSPSHRTLVGNDSVIFWTEGGGEEDLGIMALALNADDLIARAQKGGDETTLNAIKDNLNRIKLGLPIRGVNDSDRYHVIGIAPYQARLAIRFCEEGTLGELQENLRRYLRDTEMVGVQPRSIKGYLEQTAPLGKRENVPSPLITACMRALIEGAPFPQSLYGQLLSRMRADRATRNSWDMGLRAAMLKACLIRRERITGDDSRDYEGSLKMALNEENDHIAYLLGRLFAVLEKAQIEAIGAGTNATIRDRYMSSAATTPARVFPQLLRLAQHHVSKASYGGSYDRKIQDIVSRMPDAGSFPRTLTYDEQGEFYIGYYQQRQDLYTKKGEKEKPADEGRPADGEPDR